MPLYSFVDLRECKEKFVIKTSWCKGINSAKVRARGNRPTTERIIFFSPSPKDAPNFALPIERTFNATRAACYKGFVLKTFGESIFIFSPDNTIK